MSIQMIAFDYFQRRIFHYVPMLIFFLPAFPNAPILDGTEEHGRLLTLIPYACGVTLDPGSLKGCSCHFRPDYSGGNDSAS